MVYEINFKRKGYELYPLLSTIKKRVFMLGIFLILSMVVVVYAECIDSDGGKDYYTYGKLSKDGKISLDFCLSENADASHSLSGWCVGDRLDICYLVEKFCNGTDEFDSERISCPYGCINGICLKEEDKCSDSDSGISEYAKGNINIGLNLIAEDRCFDSNTLNEYYCNESFPYYSIKSFKCSNKCVSGRCIEEGITCVDSDGGINGDEHGQLDYWNENIKYTATYRDYCEEEGTLHFVVEYYCTDEGGKGIKYIDCPNGCSGGACIGGSGEIRDTKEKGCTESWECISWSECTNGQKTRTCTDRNNCGTQNNKPETSMSCDSVGNNQNQEPNQEENQKKCSEIASLNCPEGSKLENETDANGCVAKYKCSKTLSNGRKAEIKIMPETASEKAIERLGELNFTIQLKEVGKGDDPKLVYELTGNKQGKFLGIFKIIARVQAQVDAQTGNVKIIKPWWSFLASGV